MCGKTDFESLSPCSGWDKEPERGRGKIFKSKVWKNPKAKIQNHRVSTYYAPDLHTSPPVEEICNKLTDDVFITIDLDVFDPSIMPATGTPEPGGMGWYDVLGIVKAVASKKKVVGFDVVELCPIPGNIAPNFLTAKLVYRMMGYINTGRGGGR
ncbi:MAG: arginase family protein [Deltaproteobacteria bacterium]|nr:arginase family protein [Deltaproteobacteria bacterium]